MNPPVCYDLQISIYITSNNGELNVNETVSLNVSDSLEMAQFLGRFHELAQSLKVHKKP